MGSTGIARVGDAKATGTASGTGGEALRVGGTIGEAPCSKSCYKRGHEY